MRQRLGMTLVLIMVIFCFVTVATAEMVSQFSGSTTYINLGTAAPLQLTANHPMTLEAWARFSTLKIRDMIYCKNNLHKGSTYSYMLGLGGDNDLGLFYAHDGSAWQGIIDSGVEIGEWCHLVFSFDGSAMSYYRDGELVGKSDFSYNNNASHTAKIGGYNTGTDINGNLSEVRLWTRALSGAEIRAMKNLRLKGGDADLAGYWPLNDNSSQVLDYSGNHTTGTTVNVSWADDEAIEALLPAQAVFLTCPPPAIADPATGNSRFTNSNEVRVAAFPVPDDCDHYQVTTSPEPSAINGAGWLDAAITPEMVAFTPPDSEKRVAFYFWFTNSVEESALQRAVTDIIYTDRPHIEPILEFSRNDSYIEIPPALSPQLQLSGVPFTVEGWARFECFKSADALYSKNNAGTGRGSQYSHLFAVKSNGTALGVYTGHNGKPATTWFDVDTPQPLTTKQWYHIAFSYDGAKLSYYLNGARVGKEEFKCGNTASHPVRLGGYNAGSDIKGSLSEMRVWNYGRSAQDIKDMMNMRLRGTDSGLLAYWPLNDGGGERVLDMSGHNSTGTVINADWTGDIDIMAALPLVSPFINELPSAVSNLVTGSNRFINRAEAGLSLSAIPVGYDQFQLTDSGAVTAINPLGWLSTNALDQSATLNIGSGHDTNTVLYIWFTNSTASVTLHRGLMEAVYTETKPLPSVVSTLDRDYFPSTPIVIDVFEVDNGTTGGATAPVPDIEPIPLHHLSLRLISGPDEDATPDLPSINVNKPGSYQVELIAMNEAGNVATSETCTVTVTGWDGAPFIWTGLIDNDWFNPLNWDLMHPPVHTADAVINASATVNLTNATPALKSLTLGGKLVFHGWETVLNAETTTIADGGLITLPGTFTTMGDASRVQLVCADLTIATNGAIDVSGKGYASRTSNQSSGYGPGSGNFDDEGSHGAGHGGVGIPFIKFYSSGNPYGTPRAPETPGSAGGSGWASYGGAGGGVVRIDANGHVKVNGAIKAIGNAGATAGGGGSGGSIYITCATFGGDATGLITAAGGNHGARQGAGGRIAIHYDPVKQAALPLPQVTFNTQPGSRANYPNGMGTLYLSDGSWLTPPYARFDGVRFCGDWAASATINGDLAPANSIGFGEPGVVVTINGNLTLNNISFAVAEGGTLTCNNLTLTNNAALAINSALVPVPKTALATPLYGALLDVQESLVMHNGTRLYPQTFPRPYGNTANTNGVAALLKAGVITIHEGAAVSADYFGHPGALTRSSNEWNASSGSGSGRGFGLYGTYGASHGGAGKNAASARCYGSEFAPVFPGSGGGGGWNATGVMGGGAIRMHARGRFIHNGTITANGAGNGNASGGGAGGAVFITAASFKDSTNAVISASGNTGDNSSGGGRVAIGIAMNEAQIDYMLQTGLLAKGVTIATEHPPYRGTAVAAKGDANAADGTVRFMVGRNGTLILLK